MGTLDEDIEELRRDVRLSWHERDWPVWLIGSCALLGFRIARWWGAR